MQAGKIVWLVLAELAAVLPTRNQHRSRWCRGTRVATACRYGGKADLFVTFSRRPARTRGKSPHSRRTAPAAFGNNLKAQATDWSVEFTVTTSIVIKINANKPLIPLFKDKK
jgi:hypothetical protein